MVWPIGSRSSSSWWENAWFTTATGVLSAVSCPVSVRPRSSGMPSVSKYPGLTA